MSICAVTQAKHLPAQHSPAEMQGLVSASTLRLLLPTWWHPDPPHNKSTTQTEKAPVIEMLGQHVHSKIRICASATGRHNCHTSLGRNSCNRLQGIQIAELSQRKRKLGTEHLVRTGEAPARSTGLGGSPMNLSGVLHAEAPWNLYDHASLQDMASTVWSPPC